MNRFLILLGLLLAVLGVAVLLLANSIRPLGNPSQPYVRFCRIAAEGINDSSARAIQLSLNQVEGVRAVQANPASGLIAVAFEPEAVPVERLLAHLKEQKIQVQLLEDVEGKCPVPHHWLLRFRSWIPF
ncbi:MAG: hypothetical protein RMK52_04010 [Chitinophagales bacterium]|nr:hypothetical protein [Chitinophagales bacterium]MDW8393393.1 hypothetical protein [Chitinophagales bacterium]